MTTLTTIRRTACATIAAVALVPAGAGTTHATEPERVPPSGASCGAFYGSVVAGEARAGHLNGEINPGVLHQGFAGAEAFPAFSCP